MPALYLVILANGMYGHVAPIFPLHKSDFTEASFYQYLLVYQALKVSYDAVKPLKSKGSHR